MNESDMLIKIEQDLKELTSALGKRFDKIDKDEKIRDKAILNLSRKIEVLRSYAYDDAELYKDINLRIGQLTFFVRGFIKGALK